MVFTLDALNGLRAWAPPGGKLVASDPLVCRLGKTESISARPTALAVDPNESGNISTTAIGFSTGNLAIHVLDQGKRHMALAASQATNAPISALAVASNIYLAALDEGHSLTVYAIPDTERVWQGDNGNGRPLRVLASIKSTAEPTEPTLAIRILNTGIAASCVYALPVYPHGWSINLQELRLSLDGTVTRSRFATLDQLASPAKYQARSSTARPQSKVKYTSYASESSPSLNEMSKPQSFCYAHPFLLISHPDNTLRLLLVQSTVDELRMLHLRRLWGHTSSVDSARVSSQGKAVTVARGGEVRAWDGTKRGSVGVPIRSSAQSFASATLSSQSLASGHQEAALSVASVTGAQQVLGFDERQIILLIKKSQTLLTLVTHNFSWIPGLHRLHWESIPELVNTLSRNPVHGDRDFAPASKLWLISWVDCGKKLNECCGIIANRDWWTS